MSGGPESQVSALLRRLGEGDRSVEGEVWTLVYDELHAMARARMERERAGHTLQATALVHEAYTRLVEGQQVAWEGRAHFLSVASNVMRRILVDHARRRRAEKRGGGGEPESLDRVVASYERSLVDLVALDEALQRLKAAGEDLVSIVELRLFGGLTIAETARVLGVSPATVERGFRSARAFMMLELGM